MCKNCPLSGPFGPQPEIKFPLLSNFLMWVKHKLLNTHNYLIKQAEASLTLPDDSFKSRHQCTEIVNALDSLGLLGTKYWELKGNCNHDTDLEETYHDTIRTLRTLGEIEEVIIP